MESQHPLSIKEVQNIFAQVLHDFISHFTPLSSGMEMITSLQDPIWTLIQSSKNQIYAQINLIRFVFGPGSSTNQETQTLLKQYMEHMNVSITGSIQSHPKIVCGLSLWMTKNAYGHHPLRLCISKDSISIHADHVRQDAEKEDIILMHGSTIHNPREGYALYLFHLSCMEKIRLCVQRHSNHLTVHWSKA